MYCTLTHDWDYFIYYLKTSSYSPAFIFVLLKARSSNMADIAVHLSNSDVGLTLPPHKCPSLIAIFEDGLDQLAILAGIEPDVSKTDNRPVMKTYYRLIVLYNLVG